MENRSQFTFYESFFRAISRIKTPADRASAYDAICAYALYGTMPDLENLSDAAAIAFELSKPNLDASRRKAKSGRAGGKQTRSKTEANKKQNGGKKENEKEIEYENEIEKEIEYECNKADKPPVRHKYGKYSNVLLSDEDMEKLKSEFSDWEDRIERLSEYIASTGKRYKNYLATIRAWARKESKNGETGRNPEPKQLYGIYL